MGMSNTAALEAPVRQHCSAAVYRCGQRWREAGIGLADLSSPTDIAGKGVRRQDLSASRHMIFALNPMEYMGMLFVAMAGLFLGTACAFLCLLHRVIVDRLCRLYDEMDPTVLTSGCSTIAILFLAMIVTKIIVMKFIVPTLKTVSPQPPMASGVYLLAALPTLLTKGLQPMLHDLHAKLGSVFTINLFGLKNVNFLIGPEVTDHFFQGSHAEICQPEMYKLTVPIFGKGILLDADFATHSKQIKLCRDVMKMGEMTNNVDYMVRDVEVSNT
ncbi:hypothetical protein ACQ4PT_030476 [Festuca glaucescens]